MNLNFYVNGFLFIMLLVGVASFFSPVVMNRNKKLDDYESISMFGIINGGGFVGITVIALIATAMLGMSYPNGPGSKDILPETALLFGLSTANTYTGGFIHIVIGSLAIGVISFMASCLIHLGFPKQETVTSS